MKLILLRHATRTPTPQGNEHLNSRGKLQADSLFAAVQSGILPKPTRVMTSPKHRAIETVTRLSEFLAATTVSIDDRLDERNRDESASAMADRIRSLLAELENEAKGGSRASAAGTGASAPATSVVYLCSHMDWLETASAVMNSDLPSEVAEEIFNTCEVRIFEWDLPIWKFVSRHMF